MKSPSSRDLLVIVKNSSYYSEQEMQTTISELKSLLYEVETVETTCRVNEIIDLNSYKIIRRPVKLAQMLFQKRIKPFQFVINKN